MALVLKYFDIIGPCNFNFNQSNVSLYLLHMVKLFLAGLYFYIASVHSHNAIIYSFGIISVVVCTELRGKEPRRQVGAGIMVTSGSLHGAIVAHWPGMPEMWVRVLL